METSSTTTIFCSKKLADFIGKNKLQTLSSNSKFKWNGHLFYIDGRKCMAFIHKPTLYCFYILDVLKKDFRDFNHFFADGLMQQLRYDQLSNPLLEAKLWLLLSDMHLSPTDNDRKIIGTLNYYVQHIELYIADKDHVSDYKLNYRGNNVNEMLMWGLEEDYPNAAMKSWLKRNL